MVGFASLTPTLSRREREPEISRRVRSSSLLLGDGPSGLVLKHSPDGERFDVLAYHELSFDRHKDWNHRWTRMNTGEWRASAAIRGYFQSS
jgi:hypothetical protein